MDEVTIFGPASIGVTPAMASGVANRIRDAMVAAFSGLAPKWLISPIGKQGTHTVSSIDDFVTASLSHHSFFSLSDSEP